MRDDVRIGITGPASEVNFGDYAMFVNNLYDLNIRNVTLFSYNKGFSEVILKDYCGAYGIEAVEVRLHSAVPGIENQTSINESKPRVGFQPFNPPTSTPLDILYRIENYDELQACIRDIDVLIVNGGGYFNHLWNNSLWRSDMLKKIIAPILIAVQQKKKVVFTGNSFGPFDSSEEFFFYVFNYLNNTTYAVRDRLYSAKYLSRLGIDNQDIVFLPDDLYLINDAILALPGNNMLDLNGIGRYIALEAYYPVEEMKGYVDEIRSFNEKMRLKYGLSVVFLPFDLQRGGMWQGEYLKTVVDDLHLCDLNPVGYLPIQDAYQIIRNAEMVLCTRYHAMVMALGTRVPVINIIKNVCDDHRYYFNKNFGLLEYVFEGLEFNEMDFIQVDFSSALKHLEENLLNVLARQKELYSSEQYTRNKECLKAIRAGYIAGIV